MSAIYSFSDHDFDLSHTLIPVPDPDNFKLHTHAKLELYYFCQGKGIFHIEGSDYSLEPGDLLLINPQELHQPDIDADSLYERIVLWIDRSYLANLCSSAGGSCRFRPVLPDR